MILALLTAITKNAVTERHKAMQNFKTPIDRYRAACADYRRAREAFALTAKRLRARQPFSNKCNVPVPRYCPEEDQIEALAFSGKRDPALVLADKHLQICKAHWMLYALWSEMLDRHEQLVHSIPDFEQREAELYWQFDEERINALEPIAGRG